MKPRILGPLLIAGVLAVTSALGTTFADDEPTDADLTLTNANEAAELLEHYNVKYVYLGRLERLYFPGPGLAKFDSGLSDRLTKVFENEDVSIYEVQEAAF